MADIGYYVNKTYSITSRKQLETFFVFFEQDEHKLERTQHNFFNIGICRDRVQFFQHYVFTRTCRIRRGREWKSCPCEFESDSQSLRNPGKTQKMITSATLYALPFSLRFRNLLSLLSKVKKLRLSEK